VIGKSTGTLKEPFMPHRLRPGQRTKQEIVWDGTPVEIEVQVDAQGKARVLTAERLDGGEVEQWDLGRIEQWLNKGRTG
jgi:hypothetical protein